MNLESLVVEFSKRTHEKYFPHISNFDWDVVKHNENQFSFGFKPNASWGDTYRFTTEKILFSVKKYDRSDLISINTSRYSDGEKTFVTKTYDDFLSFLEEKNMNVILIPYDSNDKNKLLAIGEKANKVKEMVELLLKETKGYYFYGSLRYYRFTNHLSYDIKMNVEDGIVSLFQDGSELVKLRTVDEAKTFMKRVEDESKEMEKVEQEVINAVKKYDVTCYYYKSEFYIFNQRIGFHISKVVQNGKERFRARFDGKYNVNLKLDKLAEIVKAKADSYIKKKRVKAVMNGSSRDVFNKLMYKVHGRHVDNFSFRYEADSTMDKDSLNNFIISKIEDAKAEKVTEKHLDYFRMLIRTKKKGHRIDSGFKIAGLYVFISPSKHFFLKEEEFNASDITTYKWRKKEDRELALSLENWKNNELTSV